MAFPKSSRQAGYLAILILAAALLAGYPSGSSRASEATDIDSQLAELAPPPSDAALAMIPEFGRRLLALRSYVRAGPKKVAKRWSWTDAEIKAFEGTPEHLALVAEIDAVKAHFAETNSGYEIYVHNTVRSLDEQIRKWNSNESVGTAAQEILDGWQEKFGDSAEAGSLDMKQVRTWLAGFRLTKRANLAAPGLTLHGKASAIDFQVMKDGQIIAGANSRQIEPVWQADGWDMKLKDSITAAGPSFHGPLQRPFEPWHFDYKPGQPQAPSAETGTN